MSSKKQGGSRAKQKKILQRYSPQELTDKQYTALPPFQKIRCSTDEIKKIADDTLLPPGPLTPNHGFEFKARGLRNTSHKRQLFSKKFQTSDRRSKNPEDRVDPQPDSSNQTKARELLHIEREYITHHIPRSTQDLSTS